MKIPITLMLLLLHSVPSTCALDKFIAEETGVALLLPKNAFVQHLKKIRSRSLQDLACPLGYKRSEYVVSLLKQALALAPEEFESLMNDYILDDILTDFMRFFAKDSAMYEQLIMLLILNSQNQWYKNALIKIVYNAQTAGLKPKSM